MVAVDDDAVRLVATVACGRCDAAVDAVAVELRLLLLSLLRRRCPRDGRKR